MKKEKIIQEKMIDDIQSIFSNPDSIGVISFDEFQWHMDNFQHLLYSLKPNGDFYSLDDLGCSDDAQLSADMYFHLLSKIFGCEKNFVEGYNLIETWVFYFRFGKNFHIGNIINYGLPEDNPYHMPDLTTPRKFYEYLCLIKYVTINGTKEEIAKSTEDIYVLTPSQIRDLSNNNKELQLLSSITVTKKRGY